MMFNDALVLPFHLCFPLNYSQKASSIIRIIAVPQLKSVKMSMVPKVSEVERSIRRQGKVHVAIALCSGRARERN